ncbi:hypothetical protein KF707_13315 [Candidatus Obscuribacterales bacterium]|nr:hypothetical protein [Candidatus Obscuribacterales bacterium]MBX3137215.1 hypothetical protein [Candidatus Obscuribacterales bacterium]MBX3152496.1 hypothetical protein [Candidatus Obscuribacterales bacterium]
MFVMGAIFVYGGAALTYNAFDDAKNVLESCIFGLGIVTVGMTLMVWAFTGPPG